LIARGDLVGEPCKEVAHGILNVDKVEDWVRVCPSAVTRTGCWNWITSAPAPWPTSRLHYPDVVLSRGDAKHWLLKRAIRGARGVRGSVISALVLVKSSLDGRLLRSPTCLWQVSQDSFRGWATSHALRFLEYRSALRQVALNIPRPGDILVCEL
jgi:hypothetical protein